MTDTRTDRAAWAYLRATDEIAAAGYIRELDIYRARRLEECDESLFLSETTWVVLSSGMRESVVRKVFPGVCKAFQWFVPLDDIASDPRRFLAQASLHFNHPGKLSAIVFAVEWTVGHGLGSIIDGLANHGPGWLCRIPFIGPITANHLAKNLGYAVAKADRHMARLAPQLDFRSANDLCEAVALRTGDPPQVIDLAFWRYAILNRGSFEQLLAGRGPT